MSLLKQGLRFKMKEKINRNELDKELGYFYERDIVVEVIDLLTDKQLKDLVEILKRNY